MEKIDARHALSVITDRLSTEAINSVDAHVETTSNAEDVDTEEISGIYKIARPVLVFLLSVLVFKPTWAGAIEDLIAMLDEEYPIQDEEATAKKKATPKRKKPSPTRKSPAAAKTGE